MNRVHRTQQSARVCARILLILYMEHGRTSTEEDKRCVRSLNRVKCDEGEHDAKAHSDPYVQVADRVEEYGAAEDGEEQHHAHHVLDIVPGWRGGEGHDSTRNTCIFTDELPPRAGFILPDNLVLGLRFRRRSHYRRRCHSQLGLLQG